MIRDYLKFSWENLRHKKLRSWLTLLGIFIGIAAVVGLIGLGDGLRLAITSQFGISSTEVLSVQAGGLTAAGPPGTGVVNPLTLSDVDAIKRLTLVDSAFPRNIETGKLEFNDRAVFGTAISMPSGDDRKFAHEALELEAEEGKLLKDGDTKKVVLGNNFLTDKVGLGKAVHAGDTVLIQDEKFEVVGIVKKKGSFIFDNMVLINEDTLRDLFNIDDQVDVIAVKVKNKEMLLQAKEDIEKLMRKRRNVKVGEEDFMVDTPESALKTVKDVLLGVQIFIVIIASISIVVGGIGIVNTMLTAVLERKKQIGIMKAIGARNNDIFMLFFIESGLLGLTGGIFGAMVGTTVSYFGTKGINNFVGASASPHIDFMLIFLALIGSFVVGSIAGIIPAMRAAKLHPVDAIRG